MTLVAIVLTFASFKTDKKHKKTSDQTFNLATLPLITVLAFALLQPARSLSSSTVSQRATDAGSIITTAETEPTTLFAGSSRGLRLADWSRLLASNTDPDYYNNKPAQISGFVYNPGTGDDVLYLSRFVLTCCAVDAQPLSVPIYIENWQDSYEQDEWLEIEGQFTSQNTSQGEMLLLVPQNITPIERPDNPYAN